MTSKYLGTWEKSKISTRATLTDALKAISSSGGLMACVVAEDCRLLGILTDSDIRRAIIRGASLDDPSEQWMQKNPVIATNGAETDELLSVAESNGIREIPLVDANGILADIFVVLTHQAREQFVGMDPAKQVNPSRRLLSPMLIQAGGLGTRLRSVVSDRPKPLALVGGRPILETLIFHSASCGISEFYVSANYMADAIIEHLADKKYADFKITILREKKRLGTAGSISLITEKLSEPLLIANADILTTLPFDQLLQHHRKERADITCAVRNHHTLIPYGVVQIEDNAIVSLAEKPRFTHFVNTGIYALSPDIVEMVRKNEYLDMPHLITKALSKNSRVIPFLQHEYWADIGHPEDFLQANQDYSKHFGATHEY